MRRCQLSNRAGPPSNDLSPSVDRPNARTMLNPSLDERFKYRYGVEHRRARRSAEEVRRKCDKRLDTHWEQGVERKLLHAQLL